MLIWGSKVELPISVSEGLQNQRGGGAQESKTAGTNASDPCCQWKCTNQLEGNMHSVFYIIGVIVVVAFILSFLGVL